MLAGSIQVQAHADLEKQLILNSNDQTHNMTLATTLINKNRNKNKSSCFCRQFSSMEEYRQRGEYSRIGWRVVGRYILYLIRLLGGGGRGFRREKRKHGTLDAGGNREICSGTGQRWLLAPTHRAVIWADLTTKPREVTGGQDGDGRQDGKKRRGTREKEEKRGNREPGCRRITLVSPLF